MVHSPDHDSTNTIRLARLDRIVPPPVPLTPLIGRRDVIATLSNLLERSDARLVTLTGPGGVGKTRLALEFVNTSANSFEDGLAFVQLAALSDPELVLPTICRALGIGETTGTSSADALVDGLSGKNFLLVCDNFEPVVGAGPALVALLRACPGLRILVTSRVSLHVSGEHVVPLPPLSLPDMTKLPSIDALSEVEAVRFFVDRAQTANQSFALVPSNAQSIASICHRLDGLPLALELAAARSRVLSPVAMLSRLEMRLAFLTSGVRDLPARQQTMRGAIAWSHDLLSPEEQRLFRQLAVFSGGFTLEAAEAICSNCVGENGETFDILNGIGSLLEKSMIREAGSSSLPRYGMLETIREFGLEQLESSGEEPATRLRHATFFTELAERALPFLTSVDRAIWLGALEADHPNLRAAVGWTIANEMTELGQRLAAVLWRFWETNGHVPEGREWCERVVAIPDHTPGKARAGALTAVCILAHRQGDFERSIETGDEALEIWRAIGDRSGIGYVLNVFGNIASDSGDYERASALHSEALAIRRELGDLPAIGTSLNNLGTNALELGDLDKAWSIHQEQLALERARNDPVDVAYALSALAAVAHHRGDLEQAAAMHEEALALRRTLDPLGHAVSVSQSGLAAVLADLGEHVRALELYKESLVLRFEQNEKQGIVKSLEGIARVAMSLGQPALAVRLVGAVEALRDSSGIAPTVFERKRRDEIYNVASRSIGHATVDQSLAAGRSMPLSDAVNQALEITPNVTVGERPAASSSDDPSSLYGLTPREADVLRLLAEGKSNRDIGDELSISHRTVMVHVTNILAKLEVPSRTAAAAFAHSHGLV